MDYQRRKSAETNMSVAESRLTAGDFKLCKKFATEALYDYPSIPDDDRLHATATALLAAGTALLAAEVDPADPYEVLGLDSAEEYSRDLGAIESKYRRISDLISRSRPNRPFAVGLAFDVAIRRVDEAWAFLSDPLRKSFLDANLDAAAAAAKAAATAKANAVADAVAAAEAARAASTASPAPEGVVDAVAAAEAARAASTTSPAPEGHQPPLSNPSSSPSPSDPQTVTKRKNLKATNQASRRRRIESEPDQTQPNAGEDVVRRSGRLASKPNPNNNRPSFAEKEE